MVELTSISPEDNFFTLFKRERYSIIVPLKHELGVV